MRQSHAESESLLSFFLIFPLNLKKHRKKLPVNLTRFVALYRVEKWRNFQLVHLDLIFLSSRFCFLIR